MEELRFHPNSMGMRAFEQAIGEVYAPNSKLTLQTLQDLAARYGAWQGYWAYYLRANNSRFPAERQAIRGKNCTAGKNRQAVGVKLETPTASPLISG